jgi:hypothetical protein
VSGERALEPPNPRGKGVAHIEWRHRVDLEALDKPAPKPNLKAPRRS